MKKAVAVLAAALTLAACTLLPMAPAMVTCGGGAGAVTVKAAAVTLPTIGQCLGAAGVGTALALSSQAVSRVGGDKKPTGSDVNKNRERGERAQLEWFDEVVVPRAQSMGCNAHYNKRVYVPAQFQGSRPGVAFGQYWSEGVLKVVGLEGDRQLWSPCGESDDCYRVPDAAISCGGQIVELLEFKYLNPGVSTPISAGLALASWAGSALHGHHGPQALGFMRWARAKGVPVTYHFACGVPPWVGGMLIALAKSEGVKLALAGNQLPGARCSQVSWKHVAIEVSAVACAQVAAESCDIID